MSESNIIPNNLWADEHVLMSSYEQAHSCLSHELYQAYF